MPVVFDHVCYDYAPADAKSHGGSIPQALNDINLVIPDGQFLGIIGHTGSGKSTLVQHINGLLQPSSGRVLVDGLDLSDKKSRREVRRHVGIAFQYPEYQLFATTVFEDISFGPRNLGFAEAEVDHRVRLAMERLGLDFDELAERSPFQLSGGQQRRVALAGILAMEPRMLVLDEPMAGLDPKGREGTLALVHGLHEDGMTIVMVSHSMEDVAENADEVLVMNHGSIFMKDTPDQVFGHGAELHEIGLDVPRASKFRDELREKGLDVPRDVYTLDALADAIVARVGKRTKEEYLDKMSASGEAAAVSVNAGFNADTDAGADADADACADTDAGADAGAGE